MRISRAKFADFTGIYSIEEELGDSVSFEADPRSDLGGLKAKQLEFTFVDQR